MEVRLSSEERELMIQVLEDGERGLLKKISHANHHDSKHALEDKEELLESIIHKLRVAEPVELVSYSDLWW